MNKIPTDQIFDTLLEFCKEKNDLIADKNVESYSFSPEGLHCASVNINAQINDLLTNLPSHPSRQAGLRWVKCSDRLPQKEYWDEIHYRVNGIKEDGILCSDTDAAIVWFEYRTGTKFVQEETLSKIEWLDESQSPQVEEAVEKDELWQEVGKEFTGIIGTQQWIAAINKLKSKYTLFKQQRK